MNPFDVKKLVQVSEPNSYAELDAHADDIGIPLKERPWYENPKSVTIKETRKHKKLRLARKKKKKKISKKSKKK